MPILIQEIQLTKKKYIFSIEHLKSRNESKILIERKKRAKSDNSLDKRDKNKRQENIQINNLKGVFIKEGIDDYYNKKEQELKLKLLDKEQQTDNITLKNEISKEISIYFEIDQNYKLKIIEREKLIKDLEDKIQILNDEMSNKQVKCECGEILPLIQYSSHSDNCTVILNKLKEEAKNKNIEINPEKIEFAKRE